jgi:hypothetical protein
MIVYDLFVHKKISLKEKSLYYFHKKFKIKKNTKKHTHTKKTFLVGFFRVFLGGFFWVGFLMPTLLLNSAPNPDP